MKINCVKDYRGYRVRKLNKELKECKSKAACLLQAHIRGYLARIRFKKLTHLQSRSLANSKHRKISSDRYMRAIRVIQSYWRGYSIRKVYRELKLDRTTKSMQFGYFCEQVIFYFFFVTGLQQQKNLIIQCLTDSAP